MRKVICVFCITFVLIVTPIMAIYCLGSREFIDNFMNEQMIPLMGTIIALNIAIASSLQAVLLSIEENKNKEIFKNTRKEIKSNTIYVIFVFIIVFALQSISIKIPEILLYAITALKLTFFFTYFYAMYDLSNALFGLSKK